MMERVDQRREQLDAWRKAKGRTPMKRMSYVQEYYKPSPVPKSSTALIHSTIKRHPSQQGSVKSKSSSLRVSKPDRGVSKGVVGGPLQPLKKPQYITTTPSGKLSRREMLDQWLATHRSTVKRPRSVLQPLNQVRAQTDCRKIQPLTSVRRPPHSPSTLRHLKQQLQQELDEECQENMEADQSEGVGVSMLDKDLARGLDYSEAGTCSPTPPRPHKVRARRSLAHDPSLIFQSSTIRYSLAYSEPQRKKHKRRHTMASSSDRSIIYLTPVRRSTRHVTDECVDSPSQLATDEQFTIQIVPNKALEFDEL